MTSQYLLSITVQIPGKEEPSLIANLQIIVPCLIHNIYSIPPPKMNGRND